MSGISSDTNPPHRVNDADGDGTIREQMEVSARALVAAHNAPVDEAMNSVRWERRGLLQRLTRRDGG
jgi:hypothetical protein